MAGLSLPVNVFGIFFGVLILFVGGLAFILISLRKGKGGLFGKGYPIDVEIIEERAGNKVIDRDKARRVRIEAKGVVLELKKRKKELPPIPLNYLIIDKKGNSKLYLYTPDNEKFFPIKIQTSVEGDAKFLEEKAWDIVDYRTAVKLKELYHKPSWLEKYGNVLYLLIFGFLLILAFYVVLGKFGDIATTTKETVKISSQNLEETKELTKATRELVRLVLQVLQKSGIRIEGIGNLTTPSPTPPPY